MEPSISALFYLMGRLGKQADVLTAGNSHPLLKGAAQKYEALGVIVGEELTRRVLSAPYYSEWAYQTLLAIIQKEVSREVTKTVR